LVQALVLLETEASNHHPTMAFSLAQRLNRQVAEVECLVDHPRQVTQQHHSVAHNNSNNSRQLEILLVLQRVRQALAAVHNQLPLGANMAALV